MTAMELYVLLYLRVTFLHLLDWRALAVPCACLVPPPSFPHTAVSRCLVVAPVEALASSPHLALARRPSNFTSLHWRCLSTAPSRARTPTAQRQIAIARRGGDGPGRAAARGRLILETTTRTRRTLPWQCCRLSRVGKLGRERERGVIRYRRNSSRDLLGMLVYCFI